MWTKHVVLTSTLLGGLALGQTPPVLTIGFDKDFNANGPGGIVAARLIDKPALAPGRSGQALKSGPEFGYLEFPTDSVLDREAGTVEMWVCPLDWTPDEEKFHVFFETRGEGALYLYKYYQGDLLLMLSCDNVAGPYTTSSAPMTGWQPGQWHHIAGTWSADGVMCYVDGKPAAKQPSQGSLPRVLGKTFRIGDQPWQFARPTSSLIDDVRIYQRALSPAHIAAHMEGRYDFAMPLREDLAQLDFNLDPDQGKVAVRLSTGGADVEDARVSARIGMITKGAALSDDVPALALTGGRVVRTLPLLSREPGEYEVVGRVFLDGKEVFKLRRALVIPSMEWQGNKLGLEDKVLPPWTPLRARGTTVSCWGRDYVFDRAPLPAQIRSKGEDLLARPIALYIGGKQVDEIRQPICVRSRSAARAILDGEWRGAGTNLVTRVTAEYDGLLLVEISGQFPVGALPDRVTLEIPVKTDRAIYRHRWAPSWEGPSGNVPAGDGVVDCDKFIPYAWLGDNDRGLFWFCESDEMWPNAAATNAFQIVRAPGEVALRLNIAAGQPLPSNWRFVFGLQATPVKPLPKDWRKWRLLPATNANVGIIWPTPNKDSLRYFGYPEASDPPTFEKQIANLHASKVKAVPYLCLSFISTACPEWSFFRRNWAMGPVDSASTDVAAYGAGFAMVSPVGKGYSDFIVWKNKQFVERFDIDGLYHDNTHPYASTNTLAGCGYMRDGRAYPTYPILGFRDLYRRMYAVVKATKPDSFTMTHMSGKVTIPILAYDDSYLDGEHFRGRVKDDYLDLMTLDEFRAEFMGRQWGIIPFFLPEFPPTWRKKLNRRAV